MGSWARRCVATRKAAGLPGLRFAAWEIPANPGAREVVGSNPTDPTIDLVWLLERGKLEVVSGVPHVLSLAWVCGRILGFSAEFFRRHGQSTC